MRIHQTAAGFTIVELIVSIMVAGIFIGIISSMSTSIITLALDAQRFETASNLAYNNLRLYANGQRSSAFKFNCNGDDASDTATTSSPFTDGYKHPDATGQTLLDTTNPVSGLPGPVHQTVTAIAPYGCGNDVQSGASGTTSIMPVRVTSTITYGSSSRKVVHATYVDY